MTKAELIELLDENPSEKPTVKIQDSQGKEYNIDEVTRSRDRYTGEWTTIIVIEPK